MPTFHGRNYQLQELQTLWAPYYESVLNILGSTGFILPFGDPAHGQPNATSFETVGDIQATFTWSEAPASFDDGLDLTDPASYQGIIPILSFNGTDEEADTPDNAAWSADDSGDAGFSIGAWVNFGNLLGTKDILSRRDITGSKGEWQFSVSSAEKPRLLLVDQSASASAYSIVDTGLSQNVWHHIVATYTGAGGGSAGAGITFYIDGVSVAVTPAENQGGTYTAMENLTGKTGLGLRGDATGFWTGKMAGGPCGPWFVTHNAAGIITADEVKRLYQLGAGALAL